MLVHCIRKSGNFQQFQDSVVIGCALKIPYQDHAHDQLDEKSMSMLRGCLACTVAVAPGVLQSICLGILLQRGCPVSVRKPEKTETVNDRRHRSWLASKGTTKCLRGAIIDDRMSGRNPEATSVR